MWDFVRFAVAAGLLGVTCRVCFRYGLGVPAGTSVRSFFSRSRHVSP